MQFEPPPTNTSSASPYAATQSPFSPYHHHHHAAAASAGYHHHYPTPPPPSMPQRAHTFTYAHEYSTNSAAAAAGGSIPTPAPSPRTPQHHHHHHHQHHHARRRSHEYTSAAAEYAAAAAAAAAAEYSSPPPRPHTRAGGAGVQYMHTPLHTPPPTSHGAHHHHHHGGIPPNFYQQYMMSGFPPPPQPPQGQPDYFNVYPGGGVSSPPPRDRTRSARSHRREATWASGADHVPRSPPRPTPPRRAKTSGAAAHGHASGDAGAIDPNLLRAKAAEHGIPPDYSLKNWDPSERPIILLGSVFDASSLGEWIYNWTKFHHGRYADATKVAGNLWELLIGLGGKLKRAREFFGLIAKPENREIVEDFMENGERLWQRLKTLLKACEEYMWNGAKPASAGGASKSGTVQMGRKSGAEFVEAMFSAEKEWERTEKLMRGVATWSQRFEVNCDEILRRPDA